MTIPIPASTPSWKRTATRRRRKEETKKKRTVMKIMKVKRRVKAKIHLMMTKLKNVINLGRSQSSSYQKSWQSRALERRRRMNIPTTAQTKRMLGKSNLLYYFYE